MKFHHEIELIRQAQTVSLQSKDPSRKVGAIAVSNDRIQLSTGWNGFPRGICDTYERLHNRELKYHYTIHAELNCILNAAWSGTSLRKSNFFVYGLPVCSRCALHLVQIEISSVVCQVPSNNIHEPWLSEWNLSKQLFDEANIEYTLWNENYESI
jgi:dCMP deaminase